MPLEYRIKVSGNELAAAKVEQKDGAIRRAVVAAQKTAEHEMEVQLRAYAPNPRSAGEVQGHGVRVESTGTERFAGSFKGGVRASLRTMKLEVWLERNTVADYVEHGTGVDHYPDPHAGYFIHSELGGSKLGPWESVQIGVHGQQFDSSRVINDLTHASGNLVWADSVFIPGTRPHPWVQDAFDDIKLEVEELYHTAVSEAI